MKRRRPRAKQQHVYIRGRMVWRRVVDLPLPDRIVIQLTLPGLEVGAERNSRG